ncbi:MAG: Fe-S cluster assembly protein SufD [Chloroflexi bacterium]|nr:Fe-S cluster assembly protein SufD [Chloroflexota bacterium]
MTSAVESAAPAGNLSAEASRALGAGLGDSPRLAALRQEAAELATRMAMPTRAERPWKYLDVERLDLGGYRPALGATAAEADLRARYALAAGTPLTLQHNGATIATEARADGVTVTDFASAGASQRALIDKHLAAAVPAGRSKFTAIHYAFLRGGILVDVPANVEAAGNVRIVRVLEDDKQVAAPHTLIVTGANSRVSVIEDYRSNDGDIVVLPVVEIVPGPGSEVRYTALHRWGSHTRVFAEQRTTTERDSAVISLALVTGGQVVKGHVESSLAGRGSSSELYGLFLGDGQQHIDFYTTQDHIGADTRSDLLFKSALKGESRAVYYGLTRVGLGAKNADANQENRNLLLSRQAKAESDPVLEILTNDVIRVSHGATAGPVDEEQLYYLQTRGIARPAAEALLVRAFLGQVLDRVPDEALRDELAAVLEARIEAAP